MGDWFEFSIHDPVFLSLLSLFWTTVANAVGQDPNTGAFVMWNEPGYGLRFHFRGVERLPRRLQGRYQNIEKLNTDFKTSFASFAEVVPPANPDAGRAAWYQWEIFNQETFADFFAREARIFHAAAPLAKMSNKHPAVVIAGGANSCNDVVLHECVFIGYLRGPFPGNARSRKPQV